MFFPAYRITGFVLQRGKNEVILVQIRPSGSSKNKLKQTLCDSCIVLVSMCMYIWSSSCVFTMSYYVKLLCYIKGWYTYDVHENYPIFKTSHPPYPSTSKLLPLSWPWTSHFKPTPSPLPTLPGFFAKLEKVNKLWNNM